MSRDLRKDVRNVIEDALGRVIPEKLSEAKSDDDFKRVQKDCQFIMELLMNNFRDYLEVDVVDAAEPNDFLGFLEGIKSLTKNTANEQNVTLLVKSLQSLYGYVLTYSFK